MHSVMQLIVEQLISGSKALSPLGCCWRHMFPHAVSPAAQFAAQALSAAHSASVAHALTSLQHLVLMHVVQTSSSGLAGHIPGGPPPAPPEPVPVVVVPVAAVLVVLVAPPPEPVVAPDDPPFPPSSDPPELLDELQ
jgi:hypothetical protein